MMAAKRAFEGLDRPIPKEVVQQRRAPGANIMLSYIPGWWAIHTANQLLGDRWSRETELLFYETAYDERRRRYEATAMARVTVRVIVPDVGEIRRDGVGVGSGFGPQKAIALEGAAKEAETDATKRALVTLGLHLGLELYDSEGVLAHFTREGEEEQPAQPAAKAKPTPKPAGQPATRTAEPAREAPKAAPGGQASPDEEEKAMLAEIRQRLEEALEQDDYEAIRGLMLGAYGGQAIKDIVKERMPDLFRRIRDYVKARKESNGA